MKVSICQQDEPRPSDWTPGLVQGGRLGAKGEEIGWAAQQHASSLDRGPQADVDLHYQVRRTSCPRVSRQSARLHDWKGRLKLVCSLEGPMCLCGRNDTSLLVTHTVLLHCCSRAPCDERVCVS